MRNGQQIDSMENASCPGEVVLSYTNACGVNKKRVSKKIVVKIELEMSKKQINHRKSCQRSEHALPQTLIF